MKKFLPLLLLVIITQTGWAQSRARFGTRYQHPFGVLSLTGGLGVAYYMGDLRDGVDMAHLGLGPSISLGANYRLTENISARGEVRFYQVSADQQYSKNYKNNLSFRTRNPDVNLGLQVDLFSYSSQPLINPYLMGGIGMTYMSPKAKLNGDWYSLAPLTTELVKYNRLPLVFTGGIGVSVLASERLHLGLELCNNWVKSDYLDDVSRVYPNPGYLASDLARSLSDRRGEIGEEPATPGAPRGSEKVKDSYLFFQLRASFLIGNREEAIERRKTRCPKF